MALRALLLLAIPACSHTTVSRRAQGEPRTSVVVVEVAHGVRAHVEVGPSCSAEDAGASDAAVWVTAQR